jgi:hypothetical protein
MGKSKGRPLRLCFITLLLLMDFCHFSIVLKGYMRFPLLQLILNFLTIKETCAYLSLYIPGLERDVVRLRVRRPPSPVRPTADPRAEPSRATLRRDGPRCSAARRLRQTRERQSVRTCHQFTGSFYVFMLGIILYLYYYFRLGIVLSFYLVSSDQVSLKSTSSIHKTK